MPGGVICLLSALRFHEYTTQSPPDVWMGIRSGARVPSLGNRLVRFVRYSTESLAAGCKTHQLEGVPVRITNPAKTVADCFKCRYKIGLDVAIESLRDGWRKKRFTIDELWKFARICRVANIIRPYLEAIT